MIHEFTTYNFQGPLDLLLHLIKEADIDIFDINIAEITNQYLSYIENMESLNLNVDSEYLVMAAQLIEMKSKILLPYDDNSDTEEEEDDSREILINRLIEYQKYKEVSQQFGLLEKQRMLRFSRASSELTGFKSDEVKIGDDISLEDLVKAFELFKKRKDLDKPLNTVVTKKEYSIHRRNGEIMNMLMKQKKVSFDELFNVWSKDYVVVTFLSILDLAKKGKINISQAHNLDNIILEVKE
ncbi:MAG: segregation/condensation protein A [Bacilli bacterium]|nr:segregation/condensation protein A [Bacilli bacterium]